MIRRAGEIVLIAVVLVGGLFAWRTGRARARLEVEHARLVRAAGDLTITDPTKVHVLALETGEPLHFAWRVYLPPNYSLAVRNSQQGDCGGSWTGPATEVIARVRLREDRKTGHLRLYHHLSGGSGFLTLGVKELPGLIRGHEGEILAERLGAAWVAVVEPNRTAVLIRLTMPEAMRAKALEMFGEIDRERLIPDLFSLEFGPKAAVAGR